MTSFVSFPTTATVSSLGTTVKPLGPAAGTGMEVVAILKQSEKPTSIQLMCGNWAGNMLVTRCNKWIQNLHIISYHFISHHIISYHFISYYIISYHTRSYHIVSFQIISFHIVSYHTISFHIISYQIISYHIISYHINIISYHIISYHYHIIIISNRFFWQLASHLPLQAGDLPYQLSLAVTESLYSVDEQTPGTVLHYLRMWNPVHLGLLSSVVYQTYNMFSVFLATRRLSWPQVHPKPFAASGSLWAVRPVRPGTAGARCACRRRVATR